MKVLSIKSCRQSLDHVTVGKNVKISDFVNAYNCEIGDESKIGRACNRKNGA